MLVQALRAARPAVRRIAITRTFSVAASRRADIVQDIYLKEIKAYKPAAVSAKDSEGHVQKFSVPAAPKSPEEQDLANELKTYETQSVEVEGSSGASEGAEQAVEEDWFEPEEEATPSAAH